ncbi:MAG: PorT family protein [Bacteroidales bacterium]|nr:PorT family protein [Bacteroidales bacterium]
MKKILCLALFALMALSASAQIRIEAGTSIGGFKGTSSLEYKAKAGITAGAFYDIGFQGNPYEFLAVGLQYTENGYEAKGMDGKVSWIQLPVESRTKIAMNNNISLLVDAGVFFGYALKRSANVYWTYDSTPVVTDISDSVRKFNLGGSFGLGLGLGKFSLRFNWQRGILNLMGPTPGDVFTTNAYNTSSLRIVAGFSF